MIPPGIYKQYEHTSCYSSTITLIGNKDIDLLGGRELLLNFPFLFWFRFLGHQECGQPLYSLNGIGECASKIHSTEGLTKSQGLECLVPGAAGQEPPMATEAKASRSHDSHLALMGLIYTHRWLSDLLSKIFRCFPIVSTPLSLLTILMMTVGFCLYFFQTSFDMSPTQILQGQQLGEKRESGREKRREPDFLTFAPGCWSEVMSSWMDHGLAICGIGAPLDMIICSSLVA